MFRVVFVSFVVYLYVNGIVDRLPRLGKRELICLLLFTCNYVVSVWRGFLFLWMIGMYYVILLWHSLSLPYNYFALYGLKPQKVSHVSKRNMAIYTTQNLISIKIFFFYFYGILVMEYS